MLTFLNLLSRLEAWIPRRVPPFPGGKINYKTLCGFDWGFFEYPAHLNCPKCLYQKKGIRGFWMWQNGLFPAFFRRPFWKKSSHRPAGGIIGTKGRFTSMRKTAAGRWICPLFKLFGKKLAMYALGRIFLEGTIRAFLHLKMARKPWPLEIYCLSGLGRSPLFGNSKTWRRDLFYSEPWNSWTVFQN